MIADWLRPCISAGMLHLHEDHHELLYQLKGFPDDTPYVDLADALAQGSIAWKAPISMSESKPSRWASLSEASQADFRSVADKYTGYYCPWRDISPKSPMFPDEPTDAWEDVQGPLRVAVPPGPTPTQFVRGVDISGK